MPSSNILTSKNPISLQIRTWLEADNSSTATIGFLNTQLVVNISQEGLIKVKHITFMAPHGSSSYHLFEQVVDDLEKPGLLHQTTATDLFWEAIMAPHFRPYVSKWFDFLGTESYISF